MKNKLTPQEKRLYKWIDETLYYLWDPIGVAGVVQARDKYNSYVSELFKLVLDSQDIEQISNFLYKTESDLLGLIPDKEKSTLVAETLLNIRQAIIDEGF